jgi:cyanophycinase
MAGLLVLQGGGPFTANDDLDRRILDGVRAATGGRPRVVVLPTADAFERPADLVVAAMNWAERIGVDVEALMVLARDEALGDGPAEVVRTAGAVWLVGDSPIHLRSVLKDTPLLDAIRSVHQRGGLVVGVGGSAAALCDPMTDPRGGAFTLGLGVVRGVAVGTETETWSEDHLHRTRKLAGGDTTLVELPTGAALVLGDDGWEAVGDVTVHGDLPSAAVADRSR